MAGDFKRKIKTGNGHLQSLTSARFVHIDGSAATTVVTTQGCNLLRGVLNTKGLTVTIRTGSRQIAVIGSGASEGDLTYGAYCENGLQIDASGTGSLTIVWDN